MRRGVLTLSGAPSTTSHFGYNTSFHLDYNILSKLHCLGSPLGYCTLIFDLMRKLYIYNACIHIYSILYYSRICTLLSMGRKAQPTNQPAQYLHLRQNSYNSFTLKILDLLHYVFFITMMMDLLHYIFFHDDIDRPFTLFFFHNDDDGPLTLYFFHNDDDGPFTLYFFITMMMDLLHYFFHNDDDGPFTLNFFS